MTDSKLITLDDVRGTLSPPLTSDNKYSRGVLGLAVGSDQYPGAALLVAEAAVHTGVGMARLASSPAVEQMVVAQRPEVVIAPGQSDAIVVGCGIGEVEAADISERLARLGHELAIPAVVDAGALGQAAAIPGPKILTPHEGEMAALARWNHLPGESALSWAEALAATWGVVVYLKGHTSVVCAPDGIAHRLPPATTWLATAGTGDVLAGVMGALLAQQRGHSWSTESLALLAATAGLIHQEAAARLSREVGAGKPGPILARDLARAITPVVASLVSSGD